MKRVQGFVAGLLTAAVIMAYGVTAFAAGNGWNITVYPIKVLVNGEVLQPTDASGNPMEVFTYNGTTYAPLRALAEAYGLEVGYDSQRNIAMVNSPNKDNASPTTDSFAAAWTVKEKPVTNYGSEKIFTATYAGELGMEEFKTWWKSFSSEDLAAEMEQLAAEAQALNPGYTVTMYFSFGQYNLGTAFAYGSYEFSNANAARVWIK